MARLGEPAGDRLDRLEAELPLVSERDDLTVTLAGLLVEVGRATEARNLLLGRHFQPWEGGEGVVLATWDAAALALARSALAEHRHTDAIAAIGAALAPPRSLGEARHPLANVAELHVVRGDALHALGRADAARADWRVAAGSTGDFAQMAARVFSPRTAWSILALDRLGERAAARTLAQEVERWWRVERTVPATIDYFATSLPTMLLFVDDPQLDRDRELAEIRRQLDALDLVLDTDATTPDGGISSIDDDREGKEPT